MKTFRDSPRVEAFNIFELLAVIAIVALLAATFMQKKPVHPPRQPFFRGRCSENEREIAMAILSWSANGEDFPWEKSGKDSGTKDLIANGDPASQFKALANFIKDPRVFICPSDRLRIAATDFKTLDRTNLSYFVDVDARRGTTNSANVILIGDRHLKNGDAAVPPGSFVVTNGMALSWTLELHANSPNSPVGTLAFADGHVDRFPAYNTNLNVFARQNLERTRLLIP